MAKAREASESPSVTNKVVAGLSLQPGPLHSSSCHRTPSCSFTSQLRELMNFFQFRSESINKRLMKEELLFSAYFSVPRERKHVMYLSPASKEEDKSVAVSSLKLNVPSTVIKHSVFSDYKSLMKSLIFDSSLIWLSSAL